ncbi:hypothetical protein [Azospirillum sp.]|uniref:hypothetical protein n=1 Tax=Azospirillum sp. TaxID=34012 RepID=UPI002D66D17B|nr:hypothetical protein [Azospirillum sp.]HYD70875.1 hypothetical protein [Azospirillum sp.]
MADVTIVSEHGSFRLIERQGRYAIVEVRNGAAYALGSDEGERPGADATPQGMAGVVAPDAWVGEEEARRTFADLTSRGDDLARKVW